MRPPLGLHLSSLVLLTPVPYTFRKFMTITADLRMLVCPKQTPETTRQRPATGPNDVPVHPRCWLLASAIDICR
jgi:hypothetical protein